MAFSAFCFPGLAGLSGYLQQDWITKEIAMDVKWFVESAERALELLESNPQGISDATAKARLEQYGPNELTEKKKKTKLQIFLRQFKDMMILILIGAAIISGAVGDLKDTIVIAVIILINAIIGFIQEYRAEKAMDALKKMSAAEAKVRRQNRDLRLPLRELVPGDIVLIEAGDMIPADLRLIETHSLKVEEASLTGESYPVEKNTEALSDNDPALGDRTNMAYKNTLVTYGRAEGLVVATGMQTEIGSIAKLLQGEEPVTPLQRKLTQFSKKLSLIVLGICAVLLVTGMLRGEKPVDMLLVAISLAVAAIPEALPAVITVSLAMGARKLVRINALVRKLPAVETLGSVTFICTDKTGTLTMNKMTVKETWAARENFFGMQGDQFLLYCMAKNQDTKIEAEEKVTGDPTEVALYEYALQHEAFDHSWLEHKRAEELPFDSDRKMMTTVHQWNDKYIVITKGAVEALTEHSTIEDGSVVTQRSTEMAARGMRVLAYGSKLLDQLPADVSMEAMETDLQFVGLAGMIDPPREEAKQAVKECITAGIVPVMITGDHPETARAIASEIGIMQGADDLVLTGKELAALGEQAFMDKVEKVKVYARVNPEQKLYIVSTLQKKDHFVSMTGDGVNDAPALRQANIGVAMGITGTDVTKEAAHMILLDDNFATIIKAVREGRRIFDNIRKFIRYIMTGNSSEIWTILMAPIIGLPIPLLPIHILWINLVTDGLPALALANEPAEKDVMKRPPRATNESVFAGGLGWHVLWVGMLIGALCLGIQAWAINQGNDNWQTLVFSTLCICQMTHVMAIKSDHTLFSWKVFFSNYLLHGAVLLTFALQLALIYIPAMNTVFSTKPLSFFELSICLGAGVVVFLAVELEKLIRTRKRTTIKTSA